MTLVTYTFLIFAGVGLFLSIVSHVCSLFGIWGPLGDQTLLLHMGIFVVCLPAMFAAQSLWKNAEGKDYWKAMLRGCPDWMKYSLYCLCIYAMINFVIFIVTIGKPQSSGPVPPDVVRGFSGHWLIFYGAAFAILYSYIQVGGKSSNSTIIETLTQMKSSLFIFGSKKVTFNSKYPPEEATQRLRSNIEAGLWDSWDKTAVVGNIKGNKVRLIWHTRYIGNSFQPLFIGHIKVKNGITILEGKFSLHWFIKIFLAIWFGIILVIGFLSLYTGITDGSQRQLVVFSILAIGFALLGLSIVLLGNWIARDSVDKISKVIEVSFN